MEDKKAKTVMIFGTFDILHAGHENLFQQTRELADQVIVVLARDNTIKKLKGEHPVHSERERLKNLKEKEYADKVVLGEHKDKYKIIKKLRPEIIALGYDQFAFTYRLSKLMIDEKLATKIVRLKPYKPLIYKSRILREKHENTMDPAYAGI
jgi:FAD synthetase